VYIELVTAEKETVRALRQDPNRELAKELVLVRKEVCNLHNQTARLKSLAYQLQETLATHRIGTAFAASAEIMHAINGMLTVPQLSAFASDMSKVCRMPAPTAVLTEAGTQEFIKAGLVTEAIQGSCM